MEKELTYNEAYSKLEELVDQLEVGDIELDQLSSKIKLANELIAICEAKLRRISDNVEEATKG